MKLQFKIAGSPMVAQLFVSDAVDEFMFGYDWLAENNCEWHFGKGIVVINGVSIKLQNRPTSATVRRMYVREQVVLPPYTQVNVSVRMAYTNLRAPISDWLIEPRQIRPGVLLGRTLLPDTDEFAAIRMINLSRRKQCINGNILLGDAEAIGSVVLNCTGEIFDITTDDRAVDRAASGEISCTDQTGCGHCSPQPQVADGENCDSRWVSDGHDCTSLLAGCADSYGRPGADRNCFENCAKVALGPHSALDNSEPVRLNGPCTDKPDNLDGPGTGEWESRNKPDTNELGSMDAPGAYGPVAANGPGEKGPDNVYGPGAISSLGTGEVYVGPAATLRLVSAANLSSPRALVNIESFHNRSNCIDADQ
jgi:hypothetical protein